MQKALNIVKNVLVWLITLAALGMMAFTIFSVTTFDQANRSVFGYRFFIVQSDSMSATDFGAGDVVFVKEVDPATLVEGDIIAYVSENDFNYGETVTHKIRALATTEDGEPGFITYGTTTDADDEAIVTYERVLGKYVGSLPGLGTFFAFLKSVPGYVLCILIPFLVLIAYYGVRCVRLYRRLRQEQASELQLERRQLEEERRQLEAMRAQLQGQAARPAAPQPMVTTGAGAHAGVAQGMPVGAMTGSQRAAVQPAATARTGAHAGAGTARTAAHASAARSGVVGAHARTGGPGHAAAGRTRNLNVPSVNYGDNPTTGFEQDRSTKNSNRR